MTNLIVSRVCNQACNFCFAGDADANLAERFISMEQYERCLDYLDRSGIEQVRLLGGEPGLHPRFPELVERASRRAKTVLVFTNGLMPERAIAALEALPPERCGVVLNASAGDQRTRARQKAFLERLGAKVQPGCSLYRLDQDLESIFDWVSGTGCKPSVRLGLAHPIMGGGNDFLPTWQYRQAGQRVVQFGQACAQHGFRIELDCGFTRCMFSEAELERLRELSADLGWYCSPIIDLDLDGATFHCFPLAGRFRAALTGEVTAAELRARFLQQTAPYRAAGIYKHCADCDYRQDQTCSGGCLAHVIQRYSTQLIYR